MGNANAMMKSSHLIGKYRCHDLIRTQDFSIKRPQHGQATIEFTFAMTLTLIMTLALYMVFRWVGLDLANRRFTHENLLTNDSLRPEQQLNPDFYRPRKIDAAFRGFDLK